MVTSDSNGKTLTPDWWARVSRLLPSSSEGLPNRELDRPCKLLSLRFVLHLTLELTRFGFTLRLRSFRWCCTAPEIIENNYQAAYVQDVKKVGGETKQGKSNSRRPFPASVSCSFC
jgi:hypothetical protein